MVAHSLEDVDIILIPGFWLDASSWGEVAPALEEAGHRVRPMTLPGLESIDADRRGIRLRDHVAAVVAAVDDLDGPWFSSGTPEVARSHTPSPTRDPSGWPESCTSTRCRSGTGR